MVQKCTSVQSPYSAYIRTLSLTKASSHLAEMGTSTASLAKRSLRFRYLANPCFFVIRVSVLLSGALIHLTRNPESVAAKIFNRGAGNCVVRSTRFRCGRLEAAVVPIRLGSPRPRDSQSRTDSINREGVKVFSLFRHLGVA